MNPIYMANNIYNSLPIDVKNTIDMNMLKYGVKTDLLN